MLNDILTNVINNHHEFQPITSILVIILLFIIYRFFMHLLLRKGTHGGRKKFIL
jgi:hypothetical protein